MIIADLHQRFTRRDAELAVALLAEHGIASGRAAECALRDRGIDALLDDRRLLAALLHHSRGCIASLPLFTYVITRHALIQVGENDRVLADFAASIVLQFGLGRRAERIGDCDDATYDTLASLLAESANGDPRRALFARAHLGNYALWLSGMFPDHIESRRCKRGGPSLSYYEEMGQRGWRLAAGHRLAAEHGLAPLFALAAERFGAMRRALNHLSDTLLFPRVHSPERLMRQVSDGFGWKAA